MARVAEANTSAYIQGSVDYYAWVENGNIIVDVYFQMRRTNSYSGATWSGTAVPAICISGDSGNFNYSGSAGITVSGGQQGTWQQIYFASRTFDASRSGNTIYVGWRVTNDNSGYLEGSAVAAITLPQAYTTPSGLSVSVAERYKDGFKFNVSLSSYGVPSDASGRYIEAAVLGQNSYGGTYRYQIASNTKSASITVTNSNYRGGGLTINPNTMYYYGGYASNTQRNISTVSGSITTLADAPTLSVTRIGETSVTVSYSTPADGGKYAKNIQYSLDNGTTWTTGATVNTGAASSGTFEISNLHNGTTYTMKCRANTSSGNTAGSDVVFTTLESYKIYVPVNGKTKKVKKVYCEVGGKTKAVKKIYASVSGKTKRVF